MHRTSLSRRDFLRRSAAAGSALALPTFIPASALGRGGAVPPSERILMGAIGIGGRGTHDLAWLMAEPDVQFTAVCDVRRDRREEAQRKVNAKYGAGSCTAYRDLHELLARPDLDAVLIATGDRWHALASTFALRAGKDVYCEKPSCLTLAEGRMVMEVAQRHGRIFQTGAQRLSEANHVFAIEMARTGRLGAIHTAYADIRYRGGARHDWLPAQPEPPREELDWDAWLGPCPWRPYNKGYLTGGWYDHHDFATDVAMWGAHTVAQALAGLDLTGLTTISFTYDRPDVSLVTRLSTGVKLVLYRVPGDVWKPCEFWTGSCGERFDGSEGWAAAADGYSKPDVSAPALLDDFKKVLAEYTARTQRPMNHVRDFLDCIRSRRLAVAHPGIMFTSMAICLAADICDQVKRDVTFDLRTATFVGDVEADRLAQRAQRVPWCA
jgi:predicted dehydrogenase